MDSNSLDILENNKDAEDVDANAKKLAALLLPKMPNQPKKNFNYNDMEKSFIKQVEKDFIIIIKIKNL